MDPFSEKLALLLLDKGLTFIIGTGLTYLVARLIEKYRRTQAMTLELGKAQAAAYIQFLRLATEWHSYYEQHLYLVRGRSDLEKPEVIESRNKLGELHAEFRKVVRRDAVLLDPRLDEEIYKYARAVGLFQEKGTWEKMLTVEELREAQKIVGGMRLRLQRYFPSLPIPD